MLDFAIEVNFQSTRGHLNIETNRNAHLKQNKQKKNANSTCTNIIYHDLATTYLFRILPILI